MISHKKLFELISKNENIPEFVKTELFYLIKIRYNDLKIIDIYIELFCDTYSILIRHGTGLITQPIFNEIQERTKNYHFQLIEYKKQKKPNKYKGCIVDAYPKKNNQIQTIIDI